MKRTACLLLIFLAFSSCRRSVSKDDIAKINGYWEIEKVVFADGGEKTYKISETIDFFEIRANSGFRKKVKPQFDGNYTGAGDAERVEVITKNDKTILAYKTAFSKWEEEIISISDDKLVVANDRKTEYHYKRHVRFNLE